MKRLLQWIVGQTEALMQPTNPASEELTQSRHAETLSERVEQLVVAPADVPTQIRIGDEPVPAKFDALTGPGSAMPVKGLWTTTLRQHGPMWHLHLPRETDSQSWWRVVPQPNTRIARIDRPADIDSLFPAASGEPSTVPWGELAKIVDAVWLTERGHERLRLLKRRRQSTRTLTRTQERRYDTFELWASGCVLWLDWCFETVELYRHGRAEALFLSPITLSR
jgi:hypothetical protein